MRAQRTRREPAVMDLFEPSTSCVRDRSLEPKLTGTRKRLDAISCLEFFKDLIDAPASGTYRKRKAICNFPIGQALLDQEQNVDLDFSKRSGPRD